MIKILKNLLGGLTKDTEKNDFSEFFLNAKSNEKAKVIKKVLREATEEQRQLMRKYEQIKVS